jgi:hypothetical protein
MITIESIGDAATEWRALNTPGGYGNHFPEKPYLI